MKAKRIITFVSALALTATALPMGTFVHAADSHIYDNQDNRQLIMLGDVNDDKIVSGLDVLRLMKVVLNPKAEHSKVQSDVTGDGEINLLDLSTLKQYVMGDTVSFRGRAANNSTRKAEENMLVNMRYTKMTTIPITDQATLDYLDENNLRNSVIANGRGIDTRSIVQKAGIDKLVDSYITTSEIGLNYVIYIVDNVNSGSLWFKTDNTTPDNPIYSVDLVTDSTPCEGTNILLFQIPSQFFPVNFKNVSFGTINNQTLTNVKLTEYTSKQEILNDLLIATKTQPKSYPIYANIPSELLPSENDIIVYCKENNIFSASINHYSFNSTFTFYFKYEPVIEPAANQEVLNKMMNAILNYEESVDLGSVSAELQPTKEQLAGLMAFNDTNQTISTSDTGSLIFTTSPKKSTYNENNAYEIIKAYKNGTTDTLNDKQTQIYNKAVEITESLGMTPDKTELERAEIAYKYLVENVEYDDDAKAYIQANNKSCEKYPDVNDAYGALIDQKCVCGGYAKAFQLLLELSGVKCCYIEGYKANDENTKHAWNAAQINGRWHYFDSCWKEFNYSKEKMNKDHSADYPDLAILND